MSHWYLLPIHIRTLTTNTSNHRPRIAHPNPIHLTTKMFPPTFIPIIRNSSITIVMPNSRRLTQCTFHHMMNFNSPSATVPPQQNHNSTLPETTDNPPLPMSTNNSIPPGFTQIQRQLHSVPFRREADPYQTTPKCHQPRWPSVVICPKKSSPNNHLNPTRDDHNRKTRAKLSAISSMVRLNEHWKFPTKVSSMPRL